MSDYNFEQWKLAKPWLYGRPTTVETLALAERVAKLRHEPLTPEQIAAWAKRLTNDVKDAND